MGIENSMGKYAEFTHNQPLDTITRFFDTFYAEWILNNNNNRENDLNKEKVWVVCSQYVADSHNI